MKKIENYNLIGYIQDGYSTINIYDISDDEINWAWSDECSKYLHTSKLRYYPEYDEYKFRVGHQWYSLNDALRYNFF